MEVLHGSLQDLTGNSLHASKNVLNCILPDLYAEHLSEEGSGLGEITVGMVRSVFCHKPSNSVGTVPCLLVEVESIGVGGSEGVGLIVWSGS